MRGWIDNELKKYIREFRNKGAVLQEEPDAEMAMGGRKKRRGKKTKKTKKSRRYTRRR
jgi:hypothetical protein